MRVVPALDLLVQESLLSMPTNLLESWNPVDDVHREAEPVNVVVDG
jgi:hypothetical protein